MYIQKCDFLILCVTFSFLVTSAPFSSSSEKTFKNRSSTFRDIKKTLCEQSVFTFIVRLLTFDDPPEGNLELTETKHIFRFSKFNSESRTENRLRIGR